MNYIEKQPWGYTSYTASDMISFNTKRQNVEFITNPFFGRILFLDGILQSTTSDEYIYHESLVSLGMNNNTKKVLIAGGAEGGVAREVLKWDVEKVIMVDWEIGIQQEFDYIAQVKRNVVD